MLFIFLFAALTAGLPIQNGTVGVEKVGWAQGPQTRGTFDLLLSCLTTLSLCAWTAYHPNIHFGRSGWSRWAHRLLWMFIAVFVPEIVLWCAFDQWWAARRLKRTINQMTERKKSGKKDDIEEKKCVFCASAESRQRDQECNIPEQVGDIQEEQPPRITSLTSTSSESSSSKTSFRPWTMEQAFFALSGGFALPSPSLSRPPRTLTPLGIILLHELDILPNIDPQTITDKSKADGIAKALVCVQAAWFFVQCIARAAKGLPITALEIHVLAHVLCAFAIYAIWFRKGYDVCAPILIEGEKAENLGAFFALDAGPGPSGCEYFDSDYGCSPSAIPFVLSDIASLHTRQARHSSTKKYKYKLLQTVDLEPQSALPWTPVSKKPIPKTPEMAEHVAKANRALQLTKEHGLHIQFDKFTFNPNKNAQKGKRETNAPAEPTQNNIQTTTTFHFNERYTLPARSDLMIEGLDANTRETRMMTLQGRQFKGYAILSILYAAFHFSAWSPTHFPTAIEYTLWRVSTLVLLICPVCLSIAGLLMTLETKISKISLTPPPTATATATTTTTPPPSPSPSATPSTPSLAPPTHKLPFPLLRALKSTIHAIVVIVMFSFGLVGVIGLAGYPVARVYLLAESFAALRLVQKGVYSVVEWGEFVPHFG